MNRGSRRRISSKRGAASMRGGLTRAIAALAAGLAWWPGPIRHGDGNVAAAAPSGGVDPSLLQAMKYRTIGPHRGGRSTAVAGVAGDYRTFYMGAAGGGVWKTS